MQLFDGLLRLLRHLGSLSLERRRTGSSHASQCVCPESTAHDGDSIFRQSTPGLYFHVDEPAAQGKRPASTALHLRLDGGVTLVVRVRTTAY